MLTERLTQLQERGLNAAFSQRYAAIDLEPELEIATMVHDSPGLHASVVHLTVLAMHPVFFPDGILENIAGLGATVEAKAKSVVSNYLTTTLPPILDCLSDVHVRELDFTDAAGVLWHPKPGPVALQGDWPAELSFTAEPLWEVLGPILASQPPQQKVSWLKVYLSAQASKAPDGECLLNDQPWSEGYDAVMHFAATWPATGPFLGMKQFITLRRCDAFD